MARAETGETESALKPVSFHVPALSVLLKTLYPVPAARRACRV